MNSLKPEMNTYFAYGLTIQSELPLLHLGNSCNTPDIKIEYGSITSQETASHDGSVQILEEKSGSARYLIQHGTHITIEAQPNADPDILRANILGGCMAVLLKQLGYFVLHASCINLNQNAIAFAGGSGWGKSTLAAYFGSLGHSIITDDILALNLKNSPPTSISSYPQVKLSPEAAVAIGQSPDQLPQLHTGSLKYIHHLHKEFEAVPQPLTHLFLLELGDALEIITPSKPALFHGVMAYSHVMPKLSPQAQAKHMQDCATLIQAVPISILRRPRSLSSMDATVKAVERYLDRLQT